ncbi:phage tail sheath subtilisin-like domain-containing protein [Parerythrobacter jejuensis]|uniref:Phage tail sheath family protein n=1 Tax=Parerythrobacter jejuensis TaxID=795812 RepID=A0A845AXW3_9SPHN|nr:phage tail sheath subtilisin-like domain-containing protein [Parerythrobacter jejuensis]MXP31273.1 phage tail sheath family protein [Parerythrobacter jejuensis]MXP34033.1 phage tail sheath family protein [Parerythrobacter jejuensis]
MPEYLAPGVYVEETSFRSKSIAGVGTSTAGFVGMTARGPVAAGSSPEQPTMLTSYGDFERLYGSADDLSLSTGPIRNYLAHSVNAFFANGGGRLYVARVPGAAASKSASAVLNTGNSVPANKQVKFVAREVGGAKLPGSSTDNFKVEIFKEELETTKELADKQANGTAVELGGKTFILGTSPLETNGTAADYTGAAGTTAVKIVTLRVAVHDGTGLVYEAGGLGLHASHPRYIGLVLGDNPPRSSDRLSNPVKITIGSTAKSHELLAAILNAKASREVALTGGSDGTGAPSSGDYSDALDTLLAIEEVAIVAAPGASSFSGSTPEAVNQLLIGHAETRRSYRIAVLDPPPGKSPDDMKALKSKIDSKYASLYYPWISVSNPNASVDPTQPEEISLPPSGFVAGIYARNDVQRGVHKAPANETVTGALDLETHVRFGQQEILNPLGVNCIRSLPGRGIRVWGARTISSDPEWKYVNIRRYFLYLEASIDRGTQWAVFEPNGEQLWANVRSTISDFLYNEWANGALLGSTPKEAFFVRCDRSTMTQNDLDNGRLVCLVGVAPLTPAEFVIFRIGQATADARS